jgi:hypothetical protein
MNPLRLAAYINAGTVVLVALGTFMFHEVRNRPSPRAITPTANSGRMPLQHYGELPISFEPNAGQSDGRVQFLSRGHGYTLMLSGSEALLALKPRVSTTGFRSGRNTHPAPVLTMRLAGANSRAMSAGVDELPGKSNYLIGNNPSRWKMNLANYGAVRYEGIYPGINLFYYGNQGRLEYDFVVAPGASISSIAWSFASRGSVAPSSAVRRVDANGDLVLGIDGSEIRFSKPTAYQLPREVPDSLVMAKSGRTFSADGLQRTMVESRWVMRPGGLVGFEIGAYDPGHPLVIDPSLVYSTYLGGSGLDQASAIAVDSSGNAYVTGGTISSDFPKTGNAPQTICMDCAAGEPTVFVSKLNADGSALLYSTYLGGTGYGTGFYGDRAEGIAVDAGGNAYLSGVTDSGDFPVTPGALKTVCPSCRAGSTNAFILKLNTTGSALVFSTYLGGSGNVGGIGDWAHALAVDANGDVYVTGQTMSADFPTTSGSFQSVCKDCSGGTGVAFVSKLKADGSALLYSTMLGGTNIYGGGGGGDQGFAIAVDASGNAFVAGQAQTRDFPTTPSAFQPVNNAGTAGFVTKLNAGGSALIFSTLLSGSANDGVQSIAIDTTGNVYAAGTATSANFPITPGAFQSVCQNCDPLGYSVGFISKLKADGSALIFSTFLGGSNGDQLNGLAIDSNGNSYVAGKTASSDFPITADARQTQCGQSTARCNGDAFITEMNASGSGLIYSTYLGGIGEDAATALALDSSNSIYLAGYTFSTNFPVTSGAFQPACGGNCTRLSASDPIPYDAFVAKFGAATSAPAPKVTLAPANLVFGNQSVGSASSSQAITLTNTGNAALTSLAISIMGANSSDFTQTNTCAATLAAGAWCSISITFTPSASGSRTASVQISDNAASNPQTVPLTGSGTAAGTPSVSLSPASLAFGNQSVGSASSPQAITLTNTANATLRSLAINIAGANSNDFTQTNTCAGTLAGGASCSITVTFKPSASGSRTASVQISDNAASSPQTVPLTGSGTAAGASSVTLSPASLAFGNQSVGSASSLQAISLTNTGNATLTSLAISIAGANNIDFTQTNTCAATLAAGASCSITVTFKPSASGSRTASVQISDNAASSPQSVFLTGSGTSGLGLAIAPGSSASATISSGSTATYTLSVGGAGYSGTVTLSCSGAPQAATCTVPGSATVSGTTASTVQVSVSTTTYRALLDRPAVVPFVVGTPVLALLFLPRRIRRKASLQILGLFAITVAMLSFSGCGALGALSPHLPTGTQPGSYTLTIVASGGSLTESMQLNLNVN